MKYNSQFVILVCIVGFEHASAILCYDCNSLYDPRCGEEFDSFTLGVVNCSLKDPLEHLPPIEPTICRSIKMEINGKVRVVRQCGYLVDKDEPEKSCRRQTSVGDLYVTYCSCDTDLCNGAGVILPRVSWNLGVVFGLLACHSLISWF